MNVRATSRNESGKLILHYYVLRNSRGTQKNILSRWNKLKDDSPIFTIPKNSWIIWVPLNELWFVQTFLAMLFTFTNCFSSSTKIKHFSLFHNLFISRDKYYIIYLIILVLSIHKYTNDSLNVQVAEQVPIENWKFDRNKNILLPVKQFRSWCGYATNLY